MGVGRHEKLAGDGFEVIVPSLPGVAFSPAPDDQVRGLRFISWRLDRLMTEALDHRRYLVHGVITDVSSEFSNRFQQLSLLLPILFHAKDQQSRKRSTYRGKEELPRVHCGGMRVTARRLRWAGGLYGQGGIAAHV